jgi:hypothetical protein
MKILRKLNEKDRSSRKGAFLYQFIPEKYEALLREGIDFRSLEAFLSNVYGQLSGAFWKPRIQISFLI